MLAFGLFDAGNDWWWALDNLVVRAEVNEPPDCSGASLNASTCWPPNHKFLLVEVLGVTDPDGDEVTVTITGIEQDEPVREPGRGSGLTCPDGVMVDTSGDGSPDAAGLRCERDGTGNGRVYTVSFLAEDDRGGACSSSLTFCVPHNRRAAGCIDDGPVYDSRTCADGGGGGTVGGSAILSMAEFVTLTPEPQFVRGDVNWDESLDLTDGVRILNSIFLQGRSSSRLDCPDAADTNDDGSVDISDAIHLFLFLHLGGLAPPPPIRVADVDPSEDPLGCE